jgi:hypothetical protein
MAADDAGVGYGRTPSVPPSGLQHPDENQAGAVKAVHLGKIVSVGQRLVRFQLRPWLNLSVHYSFAKGSAPC